MRITALILVLAMVFRPSPLVAVTPDQIETAIQKAKTYLYQLQGADGTWEPTNPNADKNENTAHGLGIGGGQMGGLTAIATYAMLAVGESPHEEKLQRAIEFLKSADIEGTYAIPMRMMACTYLPQTDQLKGLVKKDLDSLLKRVKTQGNARGMFDYTDSAKQAYSHSRAQYGVLGVWAAASMGLDVPPAFWKGTQEAWIRNQDISGGWTYKHPAETEYQCTTGMTGAGIATLLLAMDGLALPPALAGNPTSPPIDRGLAWMVRNMDQYAGGKRVPHDFPFPSLYAVERVGLASGLKYIGDTDWYKKGAEFFVSNQAQDGSFPNGVRHLPVPETSFALLFLARGRAPIVMQKLQYNLATNGKTMPGPWNQRPRDAANITRWVGQQAERDLTWQIANLDFPMEDLHESQILYIAGNRPLAFTPEQEGKLKEYVETGGLILGNADGADYRFTQSFEKLAGRLFPMYEFRELPADHPLYTRGMFTRTAGPRFPKVIGLSNGARELMLLLPGDPAASWATRAFTIHRGPEAQILANIFVYANDKTNLRYKGQSYLIPANPDVKPARTLKLARLEYAGNWNPEPAAFPRLARYLLNTHSIGLDIDSVKLGDGQLLASGFSVAHLTGTSRFALSSAARKELRAFVDAGGTLVIDAAGGRGSFMDSLSIELLAVFPAEIGTMAILPADHPLYAIDKLPEVSYRRFVQPSSGFLNRPRLQAISVKGKPRIFISAEDLTVGLVGTPVDGIAGYSPSYALALVANIIKFSSPIDAK